MYISGHILYDHKEKILKAFPELENLYNLNGSRSYIQKELAKNIMNYIPDKKREYSSLSGIFSLEIIKQMSGDIPLPISPSYTLARRSSPSEDGSDSPPKKKGCGCGKKTTITKTKRINMNDCINCTKKHLSSAIVIMNEILNGYKATDHEIYLMGNLNEASEQITGFSLEISNDLRNLRVDIFETKKQVLQEHLVIAKKLWYNIDAIQKERVSQ